MNRKFTLSKKEIIKSAIEQQCRDDKQEFSNPAFNKWHDWILDKQSPSDVLHFDRIMKGYTAVVQRSASQQVVKSKPNSSSKLVEEKEKQLAKIAKRNLLENKLENIESEIFKHVNRKDISCVDLTNRIRVGLKKMLEYPEEKWNAIKNKIIANIQQEEFTITIQKVNQLKTTCGITDNRVVSYSRLF